MIAEPPPASLLAVDPGKHTAGWAWFAHGRLAACGVARVKVPKNARGPYYRQDVHEVATHGQVELASAIESACAPGRPGPDEVIVEHMRVYPGDVSSQPTSLIDVSVSAGAVLGRFPLAHHRQVYAGTWKGQMADGPSWRMIRKALSPEEISIAQACGVYDDEGPIGKSFHHGLEAIGIGLWALWRI